MHIQINPGEGIEMSEALEAHIEKSLGAVQKRFGDRLTRIEVFLKDVNGNKGGVDTHCTIEARPRSLDPSAAEGQGKDAYQAVTDAAGKLEKVLGSLFGKLDRRRA